MKTKQSRPLGSTAAHFKDNKTKYLRKLKQIYALRKDVVLLNQINDSLHKLASVPSNHGGAI